VHSRLDYGNGVLVGAPTLVGSECSGTTDLQSETLRPHHRRTRQPSLAASPGAHTVEIAILSYKVLHNTAPRYLGPPPLTRVADIPGRRALRSAIDIPGRRALRSAITDRLEAGSTLFQTFHHRRPSFSGCRFTDLELTTRHSRFGINTACGRSSTN